MAAETHLSKLLARIKELDAHLTAVRRELAAEPAATAHVPVVVTGRILNIVMSAFEIDARAEYSISMELNPKLVQLVSSDAKAIHELRNMELGILDRIHTDLVTRAEAARRELPAKGEA